MTTDDAQARREANARQPTPSHILSALNLLADYCAAHGYGCVVVGPDTAPAFLIDHVLAHPTPAVPPEGAALADLLAYIERVYLPHGPTRQLLDAYETQAARLAVLEGPRVPRLDPDDYAAIARLS